MNQVATVDSTPASARAAGPRATHRFIWSPSKSALYHSQASTFIWKVPMEGSVTTTTLCTPMLDRSRLGCRLM